jgi:hypothetical protein
MRKKHGKKLCQGSRRGPVGTMKTEYTEKSMHKYRGEHTEAERIIHKQNRTYISRTEHT